MILKVGKHRIEIQRDLINEKEINVTKCEFIFDEDITSDFVKEAYFTFDGTSYKQIITNDECDIPSEVLEKVGEVELGVVAYLVENGEEIIRYNPTPVYFTTLNGSFKENAENTQPITPSEMEQYQQALNDGLAEAQRVDIDAVKLQNVATVSVTERSGLTKSVEIYDGLKGEPGRDGIDGITPTIGDNGNWYIDTTDTGKPSRGETGATGATGQAGRDGIDGVSPTVTTSKSGTVTTIEITDKNGTHTATINDGINGSNGRDGYVQYTAGENITIENNVISATGSSNLVIDVDSYTYSDPLIISDLKPGSYTLKAAQIGAKTLFVKATSTVDTTMVTLSSMSFYYPLVVLNAPFVDGAYAFYYVANDNRTITRFTYRSSQATGFSTTNDIYPILRTHRLSSNTVASTNTFTGSNTFNTLPTSTVVPTNDDHFVNKKYVDDAVASAGGGGAIQEVDLTAGQHNLYEMDNGIYKLNATENGVYVLPRVGIMISIPNGGFILYILYKDVVYDIYRVGIVISGDVVDYYKIDSNGRKVTDKKSAWQYNASMPSGALMANNSDSYTPTGLYNPATKKYVDDSIAAAITTTLGGSY